MSEPFTNRGTFDPISAPRLDHGNYSDLNTHGAGTLSVATGGAEAQPDQSQESDPAVPATPAIGTDAELAAAEREALEAAETAREAQDRVGGLREGVALAREGRVRAHDASVVAGAGEHAAALRQAVTEARTAFEQAVDADPVLSAYRSWRWALLKTQVHYDLVAFAATQLGHERNPLGRHRPVVQTLPLDEALRQRVESPTSALVNEAHNEFAAARNAAAEGT